MNKKEEIFPFNDLNDFIGKFFGDPFFSMLDSQQIQAHIYDMGNQIVVEVELPDYKKEEIKVDVIENEIRIQGLQQQKTEILDEKKNTFHMHSNIKHFERTIPIPIRISTQPKITYKKNILTIKVNKI